MSNTLEPHMEPALVFFAVTVAPAAILGAVHLVGMIIPAVAPTLPPPPAPVVIEIPAPADTPAIPSSLNAAPASDHVK